MRQGPGSYSKKYAYNVFEFYRTGAPTQVEDGNFRLNTRFLEHSSVASPPTNQKNKQTKSHKPCRPHPKCCLLFWGTNDDHPVRSPVWSLSISSLRGVNSFKINCCYYKGEFWFQEKNKKTKNIPSRPCTTGRSYRIKRPPPQFPKSILSMKPLRG